MPGGDNQKALQLAERNYALRQTVDAYQLLIAAALAAGHPQRACQVIEQGLELPARSPPLHNLAWRAYSACGQPQRADEELRAANDTSPP